MKKIVALSVFLVFLIISLFYTSFIYLQLPLLNSVSLSPEYQEIQNQDITLIQLSDHNNIYNCWIVYRGEVYDITSFFQESNILTEAIAPYCGSLIESQEEFLQSGLPAELISYLETLDSLGPIVA